MFEERESERGKERVAERERERGKIKRQTGGQGKRERWIDIER